MKIIPAKFQPSSFKTVGGDRGERWTDWRHTLSSVNGNEKSKHPLCFAWKGYSAGFRILVKRDLKMLSSGYAQQAMLSEQAMMWIWTSHDEWMTPLMTKCIILMMNQNTKNYVYYHDFDVLVVIIPGSPKPWLSDSCKVSIILYLKSMRQYEIQWNGCSKKESLTCISESSEIVDCPSSRNPPLPFVWVFHLPFNFLCKFLKLSLI